MRTSKSTVTFRAPFALNEVIGDLPGGTCDIEVDEDEIEGVGRTVYRRVTTLLFVQSHGTTRTITVDPKDLDAALQRDAAAEQSSSS